MNGTHAAMNATAFTIGCFRSTEGFHHPVITAGNITSGARFGRIAMAMPAMTPDNAAAADDRARQASNREASQNAPAGTSLIGQSDIIRIVGLVAVSIDASAPVTRPDTYVPRIAVRTTSTAPQKGVMTNGPQFHP